MKDLMKGTPSRARYRIVLGVNDASDIEHLVRLARGFHGRLLEQRDGDVVFGHFYEAGFAAFIEAAREMPAVATWRIEEDQNAKD